MSLTTNVFREVAEQLAMRFPWIRQAGAEISTFSAALMDDLSEAFGRGVLVALLRRLPNDPDVQAAATQMAEQLQQALQINLQLLTWMVGLSLLLPMLAAGPPLLAVALRRRRLSVFVAFHHQLETAAARALQALQRAGMQVHRVPFQPGMARDQVLAATLDMVKRADALVCLPGPDPSFVDHEVGVAYADRKPVVFLVSEELRRMPGTASTRYPAFRLAPTWAADFQPLVGFVAFIGADLRATWALCASALRHPRMGVSAAMVAGTALGAMALLLAACYLQAAGIVSAVASQSPAALQQWLPLVRRELLVPHLTLLAMAGAVALLSVGFCILFLQSLARQWRARARVQLRTVEGSFSRAGWVAAVPGLEPGKPMHDCLFEDALPAHHELHAVARTG